MVTLGVSVVSLVMVLLMNLLLPLV